MQKIFELNIPIKLISEANTGFSLINPKMTWVRLKKRKETQKNAIYKHWMISSKNVTLPCHIKLTRIAPRSLDDDNLAYAFKHCRDIISDLVKPGFRLGLADNQGDISFEYDQEKGLPKQYGIRIEIFN